MTAGVDDILSDLITRVGRVRRWLLALSALRIAAAALAGVSLYIGAYAWLDHRVHFGTFGRLSALVLFGAMIAAGLYHIIRVVRRDMTYAHAANYIEARHSFDQQLVAAVEYYEGRSDYPYSRALARQLVRQVDAASRTCRFDSTVAKWQGYLLSAFVLLCIGVVGLFVRQNVLFLGSYLGRLLCPFSAIRPVPALALESTTGDLVVGVDAPVTLDVTVQGRAPESIQLVLTRIDPNDANGLSDASERIELAPAGDADGGTAFRATKSFDAPGSFRYHFETSDARSASHGIRVCELPAIESVRARISPPAPEGRDDPNGGSVQPIQPYEQEWTGEPLAVLPHSRIELTARAAMPLREATVVGPDGQPRTQPLHGADSFGFEFTADASSSIKVSGISTDGLASGEARELQVVLKPDEAPQFKLLAPEGDYLATDVASIPISFEVSDDFGLVSAQLICELPGREPVVLERASPKGAKEASLSHVLELEQHDLHAGDGILFYARAGDVDTGSGRADADACSELYLIEIRPYRQYWHPLPGGGPSSGPGGVPEDLITILEYTRAIVKKTWALARSPGSPAEDRPKLAALAEDAGYCAALLTKARDDPEANFSGGDKAVMNRILESYGQARGHLDGHDAGGALPPVQEAYRILRRFIDELHVNWAPPDSGQSPPQETPERVKLQEQPQEPEMGKERVESRLKEMQQKIESLARQQESLRADTAKALQQEKDAAAGKRAGSGQSSDKESQGQPGDRQAASAQQDRPGTQAGAGEGQAGEQASSEGSSPSQSGGSGQQRAQQSGGAQGRQAGGGQGGQSGNGQNGRSGDQQRAGVARPDSLDRESLSQTSSPGDGQGTGSGLTGGGAQDTDDARQSSDRAGQASAQADARMRMLQARQKALREQASQVSAEMGNLPASEYSSQGRARQQAKGHMDQAVEAMKEFEERLGDARYEALDSARAEDMVDLADSASRRLADAGQTIKRGLSADRDGRPDKAQEMAEQLARDAEAYDESLSEAEKQQMLARLKAAQQLLESMAGPQWTTISRGGGSGMSHVYTNDAHATAADTARLLARQFWSLALEAKNRRSRPGEEETSDVEFFEAENDFFEEAARFRSQGARK